MSLLVSSLLFLTQSILPNDDANLSDLWLISPSINTILGVYLLICVKKYQNLNFFMVHCPFVEMVHQTLTNIKHNHIISQIKFIAIRNAPSFNSTFIRLSICILSLGASHILGSLHASKQFLTCNLPKFLVMSSANVCLYVMNNTRSGLCSLTNRCMNVILPLPYRV